LNENQQRMEKLGLNTPELDEIVCALQQASMVYGAKISGSGLGDCAVGLGSFDPPSGFPYTVYPLETDPDGVRIEEVS
jgi:mevalonate kinase